MRRHKALMIPGPSEVAEDVLLQMARPVEPHYGDEWVGTYFRVEDKLKKVFQTKNDIYPLCTSGSGAMEAAVDAVTEPGDEVLVCHNGWFGERWAEMIQGAGGTPVFARVDFGQPILGEDVEKALKQHPNVRALALTHNESSSGVVSPVKEVCKAAQNHNVLTIVDTVSSMGGDDVPVDDAGVDLCVTASQKCLESPAGMGFISVSQRAWDFCRARKTPIMGWYLNLLVLRRYRENWANWHPQGPNTAAVTLYMALEAALDRILAEGLEARFARHARAARAVRAAARAIGVKTFVEDEYASKTLTTLQLPEGIDGPTLRKQVAADHQVLFAGGIAELDAILIRISHMGLTASPEFQIPALAALERCLAILGHDVKPGLATETFRTEFGSE